MTTDRYYPPAGSLGDWRRLRGPEEVREEGGMDPKKLELIMENQLLLHAGDSWSIVVIRHGYLVQECHTFNVLSHTRFDIWSGTKSFTGTAWGLLFEDSQNGRVANGQKISLDGAAYGFIPDGFPLTDPRKERILFQHLLTMTSGIPGEESGVRGMPTALGYGPFEHALGRCPNRYGRWADRLVAEPGKRWEYSDPAMCHLALAFAHITGREISDYMRERVFAPIGIENLSWDVQGGSGFIGPHTNAHTGIHISAREVARFGYLYLRRGRWAEYQIVPQWWVDLATRSSQDLNPAYGYTWWVNTHGGQWPGLPRDAFALSGFRANRCYVIPSLDLVVARVGSGPPTWDEQELITGIAGATVDGT